MKFLILIVLILLFGETCLKNQVHGKKIIKNLLKSLDNFIANMTIPSKTINKTQNFSQNIIDHLNIQIKTFAHNKAVLPKLDETLEFFLNYCKFNISSLKREIRETDFQGLKALHLHLNESLHFFFEIFIYLKKEIIIPPTVPHDFLKNIYPKFYLIYVLFFDFCNKTINHGLFDSHFPFKEVLTIYYFIYLF